MAASVALAAVLAVTFPLAPAPTAADGPGVLQPTANDSPDGATALVAPGALASHPGPSALPQEATEGDTVARGDLAVARFAVSDLDDHYDERDRRDELDAGNLSLAVAPTDSNRSDAGGWHPDAANVSVLPDPRNGTLYALWHVPEDAETGDYEVVLTEGGDASSENRSASVTFTVVERNVSFAYAESVKFQPGPTVVYGNAAVAPGTTLALQARSPGGDGFPVTETVQITPNGSFRTRMDFTGTENGTAFALTVLGHPDATVPGLIVGPPPWGSISTATSPAPPGTTAATTTGKATTATAATPAATGTSTDDPSTTTGGQPGFGLAVAALAVVLALALGVRRGSG